jgi:hypothetical protein
MQIHKPSVDIQKIEWDKRKKKWEELWNERDLWKSHRKPTQVRQIVGASLESTLDGSWEEWKLAIEYGSRWCPTSQWPSRHGDRWLGPTIWLSPIRSPSPRITDFLRQRLHIDTQSQWVWCRTDNTGQIRDTMLIEAQENGENWPEDILLHVRDLTDVAPLPNLLLEDSNSTDSENEPSQPCRGWFIEYLDKSCQTDAQSPSKECAQLEIELVESETQNLTQESNLTSQSTSTQTLTIVPFSKKSQKENMGLNHILIYEGDEDPKRHWFVCEKFWDATDITDEDKQMAQFGAALRARALTWFMNYTDNQQCSKEDIKKIFLKFFKTQDNSHLEAQKLKEIKQNLGETVWEYDKRFKYLLSQIPYAIDEKLLVQWYVAGLLQKIIIPLWMYDLQSCEDILKKSQWIEMDDEGTLSSTIAEKRLEDKLTELQQSIKNMSIACNELWCTIFSSEGHTKYYCKFSDALDPTVRCIQIETYCDICEASTNHATRDCPHNLRNARPKWCHICEENNHSTQECQLNGKNRPNIHSVYHTQVVDQHVDQANGNGYRGRGRGGYQGWGRGWGNFGRGHDRGCYYCFNCWKDDHISPDCPIKDKTDLKFCNICGVGDHSLEDCLIVLEKVMNKRNVNLLHTVPKQEILNSKNLHVVTRSGVGEDIYPDPTSRQRRDRHIYPDPDQQDKLMREAMKFFKNIDQDKINKGEHTNIYDMTLDEFLQLLKEKQWSTAWSTYWVF